MDNSQKLTKDQKRELRRQQWQQKEQQVEKNDQFKKIAMWIGASVVVILAIAGLAFIVSAPSTPSNITAPMPNDKDLFTKGNPNAKVVLVEYGDYQCPACALYNSVVKQVLAEQADNIYFVYRLFPLTQTHKNSNISAQAAFAAQKQGKFWEMHDMLYDTQKEWENDLNAADKFVVFAKELGMDADKFKADMNSDEAKKYVEDSLTAGNSVPIQATPSFFINGKKIQNPNTVEDFNKLIEEAKLNES